MLLLVKTSLSCNHFLWGLSGMAEEHGDMMAGIYGFPMVEQNWVDPSDGGRRRDTVYLQRK